MKYINIQPLPEIKFEKPKRDLCVLVVAPNEKPQKELQITGNRIRRYAEKCNADYLVIDNLPYVGHACAYKHVLSQVAKAYSKTLLLDTDIVVKECCPNIFDQVPFGKWGMTDDLPRIKTCGAYEWIKKEWHSVCEAFGKHIDLISTWNSGIVVAPPDAEIEYHAPAIPVPDVWCIEQHIFAYELLKNNSRVHTLSDVWQAGYPWSDFLSAVNNSFTIHLNGCHHHPTRLALLRHFNESTNPIPEDLLKKIATADWCPWWATKAKYNKPVAKKTSTAISCSPSDKCECAEPGFCHRHNIIKHKYWHALCQREASYRQAWDEFRLHGQPKNKRDRIKRSKAVKASSQRQSRLLRWLEMFKTPTESGIGDTAYRLLFKCDKRHENARKELTNLLRTRSCRVSMAVNALNNDYPYKAQENVD